MGVVLHCSGEQRLHALLTPLQLGLVMLLQREPPVTARPRRRQPHKLDERAAQLAGQATPEEAAAR
jgi:hypothetical protein